MAQKIAFQLYADWPNLHYRQRERLQSAREIINRQILCLRANEI